MKALYLFLWSYETVRTLQGQLEAGCRPDAHKHKAAFGKCGTLEVECKDGASWSFTLTLGPHTHPSLHARLCRAIAPVADLRG